MVRFEVETFEPEGVPHIITLTPLMDFEDGEIYDDLYFSGRLADALVDAVSLIVGEFNGWNRAQCLERVQGVLNATNNTDNKTWDIFRSLGDIDNNSILFILFRLTQSNATLEGYNLDWSFTIDTNSLMIGAGGTFPIPPWAGKVRMRETWHEHEYGGRKINCAAFAINWGLCDRPGRYLHVTIRKAFELQEALGWTEKVDYDDLKKFVMVYSKYKLNVITPPNQKPTHSYIGKDYVYNGKENIIFIYYYQNHKLDVKHYALCESPLVKSKFPNHLWCYFCDVAYRSVHGHTCEQTCQPGYKKPVYKQCDHCGLFEYRNHLCFHKQCHTCQAFHKVDVVHRCPLLFKPPKEVDQVAFIVFDLESRFEIIESTREVITSFKLDESGYYEQRGTTPITFIGHVQDSHVPNLVCAKDMFTNQKWKWFGDDCLEQFLAFCFSYNDGSFRLMLGNNVLLAHNASGYDTRLLFDAARMFVDETKFEAIMRGSKFMQLKIGSLVIRDIMLQIPGSVKSLAKDFGCQHQKGDFPFMFNKLENYAYSGVIPDLKYFALGNVKTEQQRLDLLEWHRSWTGEWNFKEQLVSYCENDVDVSCEIAKAYHDVWMEKGVAPWLKPTGAGVVHNYMGLQAFNQLVLENDPPDVSDKEEYSNWLQRMTSEKWWAVLKPYEHFFAHKALRGGRTEVKQPYFKLSDEDYAAGKRILYVDVCSMYPYQQIAHDFPVGTPTVHIWDLKYRPCKNHVNAVTCETCPDIVRHDPSITSIVHNMQPSDVSSWFGIVCVTLTPPRRMLHPVLVSYNEESQKCVATLNPEDHVEIFIGTNSLKACLANGYVLERVHCFHEYAKGNFWRDPTLKLYLDKMMNSRNAPEGEEAREAFIEKWSSVYGDEFGNMVRESWPKWGKFNAKKFVAKIIINSVWGKHAQRVIMPKTWIFDFKTDMDGIHLYFKNCTDGNRHHQNAQPMSDTRIMYTATDPLAPPDLHKQYLPAGLMVPEYGRLQLWEQMHLLGDRVLYCDTDSIIYVSEPGKYDVPIGDMVGDWEVEDVCSKHDGIREFVAWGPKSYGLKCGDGFTTVKAKGVSLKRATEKLFNFEVMKQGALEFLEHGEMTSSFIPQTNFVWRVGSSMRTIYNLKELAIKQRELKGVLKDGFMYPFGYQF